ncbi:hypothetical protein GCM10027048_20740 [Hymenobacter coalescens]
MKLDTDNSKGHSTSTSNALALITIVAGAGLSIILVLLVLVVFHNWQIAEKTGTLGDTIGGIAGPILNFAGLIIVYFSLREQFNANQSQIAQFNESKAQDRKSQLFDTCLVLVKQLLEAVPQLRKAHIEVDADLSGGVTVEGVEHDINSLSRQMMFLMSQFDFINTLSNRADFDEEHRLAIIALLGPNYLPTLSTAHGKLGYIMNRTGLGKPHQQAILEEAKEQIEQLTANFKHYRS